MTISTELKAWLTLIFLSIIWGTSFILIKKALIAYDPIQVAILRMAISGIAFLPFFLFHFRKLEWHRWKFYVVIGFTGSAIPAFLYATAQTELSSATAGILNSLTPIFALIIGVLFFKNATSYRQVTGITLGFLGASGLILLESSMANGSSKILYGLLIIAGTLCYGTNVNLIKQYFQNINSIHLSSFSFTLAGIPAILILPFTDIPDVTMNHPLGWQALGYLTLLAVFSTVLALIIFYRLVQKTDAVFGSSVAYLIPVVALLWGFIDHEPLNWLHLGSLIVIVCGVYLIKAQKNPAKL